MTALYVSYAALWALALFVLFVLREVLRETVWLKRLYEDHRKRRSADAARHGMPAPDFDVAVLGGGRRATADLLGRSHILFFLAPDDDFDVQALETSVHALWHKAEGALSVVWCGDEAGWRDKARAVHGWQVPVLLDANWRLRRGFMITTTPSAVMLDEEARVVRYGRPLPGEGAAPHAHTATAPAAG